MNFATENFPWKNAQSCFCLMNHAFSFSRKFFNFPFKVGPPPLTLLSTCWSEALALVKSHDATTQTGQEKVSDSLVHRPGVSLIYQSLLLWHPMKFVFALQLRTYLYPHSADTKAIWTWERVQTGAGGSEDVNYVPSNESVDVSCQEPLRNVIYQFRGWPLIQWCLPQQIFHDSGLLDI